MNFDIGTTLENFLKFHPNAIHYSDKGLRLYYFLKDEKEEKINNMYIFRTDEFGIYKLNKKKKVLLQYKENVIATYEDFNEFLKKEFDLNEFKRLFKPKNIDKENLFFFKISNFPLNEINKTAPFMEVNKNFLKGVELTECGIFVLIKDDKVIYYTFFF